MAKVTFTVEGNEVVVRLPIDEESVERAPMSTSGKSVVVSGTGGYLDLDAVVAGKRLKLTAMVIGLLPKGRG